MSLKIKNYKVLKMEIFIKAVTTGITLFIQAIILAFTTAFALIGMGFCTIYSKIIKKRDDK